MAELEQTTQMTTEGLFKRCIKEAYPVATVRVELHGIARFACWWFVILSIIGGLVGLVELLQ